MCKIHQVWQLPLANTHTHTDTHTHRYMCQRPHMHTHTDPCASFDCPSHTRCKVFRNLFGDPIGPAEQAYCDPSCDLDNGGCEEDEICQLLPPVCQPDAPCPFLVRCTHEGEHQTLIQLQLHHVAGSVSLSHETSSLHCLYQACL